MRAPHRFLVIALASIVAAFTATASLGTTRVETPPYPGDMSPAGLRASFSIDPTSTELMNALPEGALETVRNYVRETRALGLYGRSGVLPIVNAPSNKHVNTNAGDAIGETQSEVSVAVFGDTVVVGWNDSRGFTAGNTLSSYGYSTNGGATFVDGGNVPLALPTDQAFGDTGVDTDERGNWYLVQIYTRTAGNPNPTAEQNIAVHHGRFNGSGVLVWDSPTMAAIGTAALGNLDKCLLGTDRFTGNVYVIYTRFTAVPGIQIVRSTTLGATWDPQITLDSGSLPTASKSGARVVCGPGGEVYAVWEKGANTINCPDGTGNVANTTGVMAFSRSLNFGASYDPFSIIGTIDHSWTWSGPGDLRERANEFPDIAVDRSGGSTNGNVYVTWHESAPWTANTTGGPVRTELVVTNNNPGTPDLVSVGEDANGAITPAGDLDYWQFSAVQGQNLLIDLIPQGFNCGVTGTTRQMRMRLFATQSSYPNPTGFPDSLLAACFLGSFEDRITWTAPKTGTYLIRLQISGGTTTGTYSLRLRPLTFGAPSPARDARDVVGVRSVNQGFSWGPEQLINDDPAGLENRRPFNAVDGLGHVHTYWHDSRRPGLGSNASLTSVWGSTSRDGGVTWGPNYEVSDEVSFFSFNTLAIPNLGDYNQAAASGDKVFAAWTDQRLSTGDVRTPGTNVYSAGLGPEVYTAKVQFAVSTSCPANETAPAGTTVSRSFSITNSGTVPDRYDYTLTDTQGWAGPYSGNSGVLQPGASFTVNVDVTSPTCNGGTDVWTFQVTPTGDTDGATLCNWTVTFTPTSSTIVASAGAGGTISPSGSVPVACGADQSFSIAADACYSIADVLVDGVSVGAVASYTFTNVQADHTIAASFAAVTYTITASAGAGGSIAPSGAVAVACGADQSFTITADAGNKIDDVLVDGSSVGAVAGYTFTNVQADHTIAATFVGDLPPTVQLISPNGGERLEANQVWNVLWSASDNLGVTGIDLYLSRDNGATYPEVIATGLANTGSYPWTVTAPGFPDADDVMTHFIRVVAHDVNNTSSDVSDAGFEIVFQTADVGSALPLDFALQPIRPNPTFGAARIEYATPRESNVRLRIVDVQGREVARLVDGVVSAGRHQETWSGRASDGRVRAGLYFVRLESGSRVFTRRLAMAR